MNELKKCKKNYDKTYDDCKDLISVIIPTYNRKEFLSEAISSVILQNYGNIEIIIVDDNSTDQTDKLINEKYSKFTNIHYYRNTVNMGPGYNRLLGFKRSKGKYVVFLDDDDYYTDYNFFNSAMDIYKSNKNLAFVSANNFILYEENKKLVENKLNFNKMISKKEYLTNFQMDEYPKPQSTFTTIFNRKVLNKVGISDVKMVNDTIIYLRALLGGDAAFIENIVGVYRVHKKNISKGCSSEFIIKNLDEKYEIYNLAKNREEFKNLINENWLNEQIFLTIDYYISESKVKINDCIKIIKWINKNIRYKKYEQIIKILKEFIIRYGKSA